MTWRQRITLLVLVTVGYLFVYAMGQPWAAQPVWLTATQAERAVLADHDPDRLEAIDCRGYGRHHGRRFRHFVCYAEGPDAVCLYHFRIYTTTGGLRYRPFAEAC